MNSELDSMLKDCDEELNEVASMISSLSPFAKERKYLTNYALIKACGTVEYVYRNIVADHFAELGNSRIDHYLEQRIRNGSMSVKYNKMIELLGSFDQEWKRTFQNKVKNLSQGSVLISSANSLAANRNEFAHGKTTTVSFNEIKSYYGNVVKLINIFDNVVNS